ncbi:Protein of unknown function UPF0254 [Methanothermus fervidus DSM 2088]|uniref:UPF0254 protein Mfer_0767 n=1 Tax=Methanothermus fervidus (strain ATCC 43054 / DSM 2088 / JCM 10308 / V24 S) TaxID=523846 RepID=E3GZ34_METFV|nr:UPF0254 family protein [Methanothermus fervidus]ADP77566.1 Protein of unknown function UPF0254 [Methanothermus fervidus DSM 2088]
MIRVATAECFTHGKIGREIHAFAQGYPLNYDWSIKREDYKISLVAALFIPTISGLKTILKIKPLTPDHVLGDIKVYNEKSDKKMALKMAKSIKRITNADIGIGTTAGVGRGGIAIVTNKSEIITDSGVHADLRFSEPKKILERQAHGIKRCLKLFEKVLIDEFK